MEFMRLLQFAVEHDASDVHLQAGLRPSVRIGGIIRITDQPALTDDEVREFIRSISPPRFHENLDERLYVGMDFSYAAPGMSRFRCSAYRHLGTAGIAMRIIKSEIPSIEDLHLPAIIADIALSGRGLTLLTGTTGSGKSTTLATMINLINHTHSAKIITIEDPV
jgi:twitching motility protein PilT